MLLPQLPLDPDIDMDKLASIEDICGRDIKNTVVKSAIKIAIDGKTCISQQVLEDTLKSIIESNNEITGRKLTEDEKKEISEKIKSKLAN